MTDLYDFPSDHVGRKSYVTVRGHSRSIPKYKTYLGTDRHNYLLPEYGGDYSGVAHGGGAYILPDKLRYISPMDGTEITSRSTHRDHMRRHGVVEAGDMKLGQQRSESAPMPRVGTDIQRAIAELRSR
jgi:hypothetical protein